MRTTNSLCRIITITLALLAQIANAQQQACWSGIWTGTRSFTSSSCNFRETTAVTINISVANGVVSGNGYETGVYCYDSTTCEISGYGTQSGSLSGIVSSNFFDVTGSWVNSCNGQSYPIHMYGYLNGCTITGGTVLSLTRQSGCDSCMVTPTITWNSPAAITYGTPLSSSQLDATANVAGSFTYTPPSGTVLNAGTNTLSAIFTPTDTVDYSTATDTVSLVVIPATATVSGQVTCSCDNSPIAGVTVNIGSQSAQTDTGGNYSISGLYQQTYTATVSAPYYSTVTSSLTISSSSPVSQNFTLTPNGTDPALVITIVPPNSIVPVPEYNGTAMSAVFTPGLGLDLVQAACRLGFNHFNWIQLASGGSYRGVLYDCQKTYQETYFIDPPYKMCDGQPYEVAVPGGYVAADNLPFYYNEGTGANDPFDILNKLGANGMTLSFFDQPSLTISDDVANFITSLVGVRDDETFMYLGRFTWESTFNGKYNDAPVLAASAIVLTNGTGGIFGVQTNVQPVNIPQSGVVLMNQIGGLYPVTVQPTSQTVVSGANVSFAISPTNFASPLNYQWRINGTKISNATNLTLNLLVVTTNSTGNYDAVLSNSNSNMASAVGTLTVLNAPLFQSPVVTTNGLVLSWATAQGKIYQLQYNTNLTHVNWINVGSTVTASNTVLSATNVFGSDKQRFYRVQQQ